jgi:hypothetical protein
VTPSLSLTDRIVGHCDGSSGAWLRSCGPRAQRNSGEYLLGRTIGAILSQNALSDNPVQFMLTH